MASAQMMRFLLSIKHSYGIQDVSLIIPLGPSDQSYLHLLPELQKNLAGAEIIFSSTTPEPSSMQEWRASLQDTHTVHWVVGPPGRGKQMNLGFQRAGRTFLWFLHADSRFHHSTLDLLQLSLNSGPNKVHYFRLNFLPDGPPLMRLNSWGANIRSQLFGLPFGDQGFLLSRSHFAQLQGFPENLPWGEDHAFVWKVKRAGISLNCTQGILLTSARKYREKGWPKTTLRHLYLTTYQAGREFLLLVRDKWKT